ncbi:MAG: exo-alpha-sialidase, partial [Candidatus Dormibacteraeota bacterium]|nr:exo-alpha-sialidase [Candidatus Dormibacteraeota bacterium]
ALVLRPDCSRGGGDAEIQLSQPGSGGPQRVQFADLNGLDSISCAYSDDGGDTFHDLPAFVLSGNPVPGSACNEGGTVPPTCQTVPPPTNTCGTLGTDRQWIAVWPKADQPGGTTDHLYMTFDTGDQPPSGDAAIYSNDNGNTWTAACTTLTGPSCLGGANGVGSRPGPLVINPTLLNTVTGTANVVGGTYPTLYEFMGTSSNGTEVNISCDGGQTWSNVATSNGQVGSTTDDFVVGGIDQNGEVYTAYSVANGSSPWRVWFAHSTDSKQVGDCSQAIPGAGRWSSPTALTGPPSTSDGVGPTPVPGQTYAVMPWLTAGSAGRIDLVYYGTSAGVGLSPDSQAATWYLHMAQSLDGGATWTDEQASETPMHVKSICFSGIGCTAQTPPGGDRNLLDFFQVKLDSHGRAIIIYTDDNNTAACAPTCSPGIGLISSVQQASGPSLYGGSVPSITNGLSQSLDVRTAGANADVTDPTGDAVLANPGHNIQGTPVPAADITDLKVCTTHTTACPVANTAPNTLSFLFTVASLSGGPGSAVVTANGSTSANWLVTWRTNNDLWFAQAVTDPAGTLTCTYGRPQSIFNDGEPKAVEYIGNPEAMHLPATSCLANNTANTIEIDVPMDSISGLATASELYGLTGWTGNATAALPATVCQTAPGGTDCSGALGFFNNIDETAPLDVLLSGSQTVTPEVPSAPLLIGLGALAVLGGGYLRRWRRSSAL